jgi:hypothetical protein
MTWVPGLPKLKDADGYGDCLCGLSYEEVQLRVLGRPGEAGLEKVEHRQPSVFLGPSPVPPFVLEPYASALWQFESLMADLACEQDRQDEWPHMRYLALNSLPLKESLWWLRRFDTAFGIDGIDQLIANASRSYNDRQVLFLLPVSRTRFGRTQKLGPTQDELKGCSLMFPRMRGPHGETLPDIDDIGALKVREFACDDRALQATKFQIDAVLTEITKASRQGEKCAEDWRTSYKPGSKVGPAPDEPSQSRVFVPGRRYQKIGSLSWRQDFSLRSDRPCSQLRWRTRLRAHNMVDRALSYTAVDSVNGCWNMMERLVSFSAKPETVQTQQCPFEAEDPRYWETPCCNPRLSREQCCKATDIIVNKTFPNGVNATLFLQHCRKDHSGGDKYVRTVIAASAAWKRFVTEPSGQQSCVRILAAREQAHVANWQTVTRCHADIMGRYDRSQQMYVGTPCLVDEDCFTQCIKPGLRSLRVMTSVDAAAQEQREVLGFCRVPTVHRHKYMVNCLAKRGGPEILGYFGISLQVLPWIAETERELEVAVARKEYFHFQCIGPYAPSGANNFSNLTCFAREGCNWNHQIDTREECVGTAFLESRDLSFCTCAEGFCPQISFSGGCFNSKMTDAHCYEAREILRPFERKCVSQSVSYSSMRLCVLQIVLHDKMLRNCIRDNCLPKNEFKLEDLQCVDRMKVFFSACYSECMIPTGGNPSNNRNVCYYELSPEESDKDCYELAGDAQLHYANAGANTSARFLPSLERPEGRKPRYCSVNVWLQAKNKDRKRNLLLEREELNSVMQAGEEERIMLASTDGETYKDLMQHERIAVQPPGCSIGLVPMSLLSDKACKVRSEPTAGKFCCMTPTNMTHGICVHCVDANTTVCRPGLVVQARWPPNDGRIGMATISHDLGDGKAFVLWADGREEFQTVVWAHIFLPEEDGYSAKCVPDSEGCSSHHQCAKSGEYCFSCEKCRIAYGGNPAPELCYPCPSYREGGCKNLTQCERLQDAVDDQCPWHLAKEWCGCKNEWKVYGEYPGAPSEDSINGCFFDENVGYRWCEVNAPEFDMYQQPSCEAERIVAKDRFIYWKLCEAPDCTHCSCDCSRTCQAFDVMPVYGRMPALVKDAAGNLTYPFPPSMLALSGVVSANCSKTGKERLRGQCPFCTVCCADWCHAIADTQGSRVKSANTTGNSTGNATSTTTTTPYWMVATSTTTTMFDCTITNITGCADLPRGWTDRRGRSCLVYESKKLCTLAGGTGTGWTSTLGIKEYASQGRNAIDTCCVCGGGTDCADEPFEWKDADGNGCLDYTIHRWCNFSGYGIGWDPLWGPFTIGSGGRDAISACCTCGGGQPQEVLKPTLHFVEDTVTCEDAIPQRGKYGRAPWITRGRDLCPGLNGICQHKLIAKKLTIDGSSVPDNARMYALCEQLGYDTGMAQQFEDGASSNAWVWPSWPPTGRRLEEMRLDRARKVTPLQRRLQEYGATMRVDYYANNGNGVCYYKLPDPFLFFGGPNLRDKPPWLFNTSVFYGAPKVAMLGWPEQFMLALPDLDDPSLEASARLRAKLAELGIQIITGYTFQQNMASWRAIYAETVGLCDPPMAPRSYFKKAEQMVFWEPRYMTGRDQTGQLTGRACMSSRCDVDPNVLDATECEQLQGCTKQCTYCASKELLTRDEGMCYTKDSPSKCTNELGGTPVAGWIFSERDGVSHYSQVCALPHRPLMYCLGEHEYIKRCAHFSQDDCDHDPMAKMIGCVLRVRMCQTKEECSLQGQCSDVDIGLTWAQPNTCIVTPVSDTLLAEVCDPVTDLCYFRLDPPFGMEVRRKHWMLDLTGESGDVDEGLTSPPFAEDESFEHMRQAGRLSKSECASLQLPRGQTAIWWERARTSTKCRRLAGCCRAISGDRCELFSGPAIDELANPTEAAAMAEECESCGGKWTNVFRWVTFDPILGAGWKAGGMQDSGRDFRLRAWVSMNAWDQVVDLDIIRQLYENVLETRLGQHRLLCAQCLLEPLMGALASVASACSSSYNEVPEELLLENYKRTQELLDLAAFYLQIKNAETEVHKARAQLVTAVPEPQPPVLFLGNVSASRMIPGRASFSGKAELHWHQYSSLASPSGLGFRPDNFLSAGGTVFSVFLEAEEYFYGMAAPQIGLPGRITDVRTRLVDSFVLAPDQTTTTLPPLQESVQVGEVPGYPAWLVNDMMLLDRANAEGTSYEEQKAASNAEEAKAQQAQIETAASYKKALDEKRKREAAIARESTAIPSSSKDVMANPYWPLPGGKQRPDDKVFPDNYPTHISERIAKEAQLLLGPNYGDASDWIPLHAINDTCRNVLTNEIGDIFGMLLGDCVRVESTTPIYNSVELCLRIERDGSALAATELGAYTGVVIDFARRVPIPEGYNLTKPPEPPPLDLNIANQAWNFETNDMYGRLKPGWTLFKAQNVSQLVNFQQNGSLVCAPIYDAGSYCPVARLDAKIFFPVPRKPFNSKDEFTRLSGSCPELDAVSSFIQTRNFNNSLSPIPYRPLDYQVEQVDVLALQAANQKKREAARLYELLTAFTSKYDILPPEPPVSSDAICGPGQCMYFRGRGMQVANLGEFPGEECVITC